ncbi:MAG: hypothetical protein BWK79_13215 [Beggiatoa sp. IS2]|nr:MAG: hypothetical protein BWK79_13215 [Beggiatoa sp. IS2]
MKYDSFLRKHQYPRPLEILSIPTIAHKPNGYQQENYLISHEGYWDKQGKITWIKLSDLADDVTGDLWINGYSSSHGLNDRMPVHEANKLNHSALLIQPDTLALEIHNEWAGKKKVRAVFSLNDTLYQLIVTDPKIEDFFLSNGHGKYHLNAKQAYLCLSVGEPFQGYCYKLVASILFKHWWLPYLAFARRFFSG